MDAIDENSPQAINETYKIWKKNVPFLYNVMQVYQLPSCSQTIEWIPERYVHQSWEVNKLVVGSNSITKNYIMVIDVKLPTEDSLVDYTSYKEISSDSNIGTLGQQTLKIARFYPQNGEIMKAKVFKGENSQMMAACVGGQNYQYFIYDMSQDPEMVQKNKIVLQAHECEGFGLDCHPKQQNYLASGSFDKKMCLWNLKSKISAKIVKPQRIFQHSAAVEDVKWCRKDNNLLGSVTQDKQVCIWDIRQENNHKPAISKVAHKGEVFTLDFSFHSPFLMLTGGDDTDINLWDTRNMQRVLQTFIGHNDSVSSVRWSSNNPYTFTSSSFDRRCVVWDVRGFKENQQQTSNDELLFIHGGHRSKVLDLCSNAESTIYASTEQANTLHIWQMNDKISEGK